MYIQYKYLILFGLFSIVFFISNCAYKKTVFDEYFDELDRFLTYKEKQQIKNCKDVDCIVSFIVDKEYPKDKKKFIRPSKINELLDSAKVINNHRGLVLSIAYQKYLNKEDISIEKIKKDVVAFYEKEERETVDYITNKIKLLTKIAKTNFHFFNEGDTLSLELPLEKFGNKAEVVFYQKYSPKNFIDTLFVKCVILEKKIVEPNLKNDFSHDSFYFTVKILNKKSTLLFVDERYNIGSITDIDLYDYGRPIENCN